MLETVRQDIAIALRQLRRSPVFALTAAISLAVGIGANTAIFSVVNGLFLKPRPGIHEADTLVDVGRTRRGAGFDTTSYPNYLDLRERVTSFEGLAAYRVEPIAMSLRDPVAGSSEPERIYVTTASENYFGVLRMKPAAGRLFAPDEDTAARRRPTIVLSDALWTRKYNRDLSVLGRAILLNGVETTIVGVAPAGFRGINLMGADAWVPIGTFPVFNPRGDGMLTNRRAVWLVLFGRLRPDVAASQAQAQLTSAGAGLASEYPDTNRDMNWTLSTSSLVPAPFRGAVTGFLAVLMVIVGLVLTIACVNLAGVLLARGATRRREIAVRLAVGAGRRRLVRQLVTETLTLFVIGGALGMLLARWLTGLLASRADVLPFAVAVDVSLDARVLLFAMAVSLLAGVLSGLVPALQAARTDLVAGLKDESAAGFRRLRLRGALLVGQVALSCLLFLAAALFARSLQQASRIDPGFDATNVDVISLDLTMGGHRGEAAVRFGEALLERARRVPGVTSAALTRMIPLTGGGMGLGAVVPAGRDPREAIDADWNIVTPGYFETLRVPILAGRTFSSADRAGAPAVAIVNETFARRAWPQGQAVGQRLIRQVFDQRSELLVIGVARDGKYRTLGEAPVAYIYVPHAQEAAADMSLLVKRQGSASAVPAIRGVLRALDPNLPVISARSFADAVGIALVPQQVAARLAGALGLLGLLLAAFGIYGVTAFAAAQQRNELGVRMALGAARREIVFLVLRRGLALAVAGVGLGLMLGYAAAQVLSSLLYGLGANDPLTFAAVAVVFLGVAGLASYLPARHAARVDPIRALRVS